MRRLSAGLRSLVASESGILAAMLLAGAAVWGFIELADEVLEGDTHAADVAILLALRQPGDPDSPIGPPWFRESVRDLTALGGYSILTLLVASVTCFLLIQRRAGTAVFLLVAVVGGQLLTLALKAGFSRPRPDLVPHGEYTLTASFPSGHSMMAAVTYLTLSAILARTRPRTREKVFLIALAILLSLLVAFSRVYLAVHWPSDVVAGLTAGAAWALLCWTAAQGLEGRRRVNLRGAV